MLGIKESYQEKRKKKGSAGIVTLEHLSACRGLCGLKMSKRQPSSEELLNSDDGWIFFSELNFQYILTVIDNTANACQVTSVLSFCNLQAVLKGSKMHSLGDSQEGSCYLSLLMRMHLCCPASSEN